MIGDCGNDRSYEHSYGNSRATQFRNRSQSVLRQRGSRLELSSQFRLQTGDRDVHGDTVMSSQLLQHIDIPRDEMILGDDANRIGEIGKDLQALSSQPQFPFNGLITIGHTTERYHPRNPLRGSQFIPQKRWCVFLDHDSRFKIQASRKTKIFVSWPRKTIDTTMFAPTVRINARIKPNVRTVVPSDNRFRGVAIEMSLRLGSFPILATIQIKFQMQTIKPIGRILRRPSSLDSPGNTVHTNSILNAL